MTTLEKQAYLKKVFGLGVASGAIRTLKDLAEQLEMDASGLSSAMNGRERNLTDRLIRRVQKWARLNGIEDENGEMKPVPVKPAEPQPEDWMQRLIESQQRTIESQQRTIEALTQMRTGASYPATMYAPKNLRTEK